MPHLIIDRVCVMLPGGIVEGALDRISRGGILRTLLGDVLSCRQMQHEHAPQARAMAPANMADIMGWPGKDQLATGADAYQMLWHEDIEGSLNEAGTWLGGRCVYEREALGECQS